jgi:hypothetical protein
MEETRQGRRAEYLAKAAEADKYSANATDLHVKERWKTLADGYRELAARNTR